MIEASLNHILTKGLSFAGSGQAKRPWSPCNVEGEKKEKGEVLHLFRCYTHTHSWPGPGKPWKARGREKRTQTTGQGRNSAGGEGNKRTSRTNLHGETDLTNTEHTPEPHNTLSRGTGEELGTEWGTSWWRQWNNKVIKGIQFTASLHSRALFPQRGPWSSQATWA